MIGSLRSLNGNVPMVARAIVRANNDPDKQGRIRLEYPWFHGDSAQKPSQWARVCIPYASKESGMWMLPEVGDECLIFFENGSLDSPILLGTLYNGKNAPPASGRGGDGNANNKNDLKYIKTRSGHLLCFDDSDDNAGIVIKDKDDRKFEIKTKAKQIVIADDKQNQILIDGSGEITIKNSKGDKVCLQGNAIVIHSAGTISLTEGASQSLVMGDAFMNYFNTHIHTSPVGPCTPPVVPMLPTMLSKKVKTG